MTTREKLVEIGTLKKMLGGIQSLTAIEDPMTTVVETDAAQLEIDIQTENTMTIDDAIIGQSDMMIAGDR